MTTQILRTILPEYLIQRLRDSFSRITVGAGCGLRFDPGPSNQSYASGNNELPLQQALAGCLKPGVVFYDIGANVGFFTVIGARLVGPKGTVYAFEPVVENAAYIRLNIKKNRFRNVTVIEKAVSCSSGKGELWLAEYSGGGALTTATRPPDAKGAIPVDLISVDDFIFQQDGLPPTVVKIDVEGVEIDVLQGMSRTLREIKPIVIFEIDDAKLEPFQRKYAACESFLTDLGYRVRRLKDSYPNINWLVGHAIAIPT